MSMRERAQLVLEKQTSLRDAAETILHGPRDLAVYVIIIGLEKLKAVSRRETRRELRREVRPEFRAGRVTGSVVLTERAKRRIIEHSQRLFDEWKINSNTSLGDATKEQLLRVAGNEEMSTKGHIRTQMFYRALAEPMKPGQSVRDYWSDKQAEKIKKRIWKDTEELRPMLG